MIFQCYSSLLLWWVTTILKWLKRWRITYGVRSSFAVNRWMLFRVSLVDLLLLGYLLGFQISHIVWFPLTVLCFVLFCLIIELRFNCASVSFFEVLFIESVRFSFTCLLYFVPSSYLQISEGRRLFQLSTISWSICMFLSSDNYKLELSTYTRAVNIESREIWRHARHWNGQRSSVNMCHGNSR